MYRTRIECKHAAARRRRENNDKLNVILEMGEDGVRNSILTRCAPKIRHSGGSSRIRIEAFSVVSFICILPIHLCICKNNVDSGSSSSSSSHATTSLSAVPPRSSGG